MKNSRWALILGSSSGSGAAIARALAKDLGLNIFGIHRGNHPEEAAAVRRDVEACAVRMVERISEAGREDSINGAAAQVIETAGPGSIQIFVHSIANASVGQLVVGDAVLHPKQINKTFESMAHSFVYWTRELVNRKMMVPEGRLLALSNAIVEANLGACSAIGAAKAALEMYVKYLAMELGPTGLRVNALRFSTVETPALQWIFPNGGWERLRTMHETMSPAGRLLRTDEVGAFVSVLAGDAGNWFNGAVIDFTGGQMHSLYQQWTDHLLQENRGHE